MRRGEAGYLYEVPLLTVGMLILLAVVPPLLPTWAARTLVGLGAAGIVVGLYYMIVIPGWRPGVKARSAAVRWLAFLLAAGVVVVAGAFCFA